MSDEIRIYHVDDPNDAPNRRPSALPTINPWLQTPLPSFVIPPVADRLQAAMSYWIHSAYMQGMAYQQQQQQQQRQLEQLQHHRQLHHHIQQQQQTQQQQQQQQSHHLPHHNHPHHDPHQLQQDIQPSPSAASTAQMTSSSSSSSSSAASCSSSSTSSNSPQSTTNGFDHPHHHHHHHHHHRSDSVEQEQTPHQPHIKKPLNPFMIFMQKQRPQIVQQGIIKESAAINQLLGQQWRKLSREEQEPYYKLAEEEKLLHAQKYPGWSARDNYANQKRRKKLKFKTISLNGIDQSAKKCRARFGIGHQGLWCKPCKRKKKCIYSTRATIINNNNNQP